MSYYQAMFQAVDHPYLVPYEHSFRISDRTTRPEEEQAGKKRNKKPRKKAIQELDDLQRRLYADNRWAVLLVFQAMDAAGKDSTIRAVMRGVNPAGCQVFSFKQPSSEELDHDFLWRTHHDLPERGRIGIFNRSYYEEVLVVRVHPEYLGPQRLPFQLEPEDLWKERFESIANHELHLARNGTVILKFWLNVSKEEQRQRFLSRIDEPEKNWKFSAGDIRERQLWDRYMQAYEDVLNHTSRPWAPWFAIPADDKPYMRRVVAEIVVENLASLDLEYPEIDPTIKENLGELRSTLCKE